jgi:hypothetical protein
MRVLALPRNPGRSKVLFMMQRQSTGFLKFFVLCAALMLVAAPRPLAAEPAPAAVSAFNTYFRRVEARLAQQHRAQKGYLAPAQSEQSLRRGELIVEQLTPSAGMDLPGAMLHHWRGTAFAPGAKAADFERLMKDFNAYPQHYSPQILRAKILTAHNDHLQAVMRVRQRHVITVVMDTSYDITFARLDAQHGYSISRSTKITEIGSPGTRSEHALSYEERDGGLYMQIESVSLTRSIPRGLGWAVGPFVESVPRESLDFTLRSTCNALRR